MKALILAGGSGTRLWPVSREKRPKQFHAFRGDRTLLQMTFDRLDFLRPSDIFVSTSAQYASEIKSQLAALPKSNIFIEPESRDTGPAILYAARLLSKKFKSNEVMSVIYADHIIQNTDEFRKKIIFAESWARAHHTLNIIEVKAQSPNPNLGYVKIGKRLQCDGNEVFELDHFVEKPDTETAKKYLSSHKYLWNTGIYVWELSTIIKSYEKYAPEIYTAIFKGHSPYAECPKISVDYAVMEKIPTKQVNIIPADLGWSDIGTWSALYDELTTEDDGNFVQGEHLSVDTGGSVIFGKAGKLIVTSGLKNMVVVDTDDALLIIPKNKAADVKKITEELRRQKKDKFL